MNQTIKPIYADELFRMTKEVRDMIKKSNTELLVKFDETVGIQLQKTLEKAIKDTCGEDYLNKTKERSDFWTAFRAENVTGKHGGSLINEKYNEIMNILKK